MIDEIDNYRKKTNDSGIALEISRIGFDDMIKNLVKYIHPILMNLYPKLKEVPYEVYTKLVRNSLLEILLKLDDLRNLEWQQRLASSQRWRHCDFKYLS